MFYKVDYPNKSTNRITGIASNKEIIGVYGNGSTALYSSFTAIYHTPSPSQSPYPTFVADNYPDAPNGTYMTSIMVPSASATPVTAGYVIDPNAHNGNLPGDWAVVNNAGLWTLIQNHPKAGANCHVQEIFGIDPQYDAVGLYGKSTQTPPDHCTASEPSTYTQFATEIEAGETFKDFSGVVGSNPVATGIYETGTGNSSVAWVVGSTDYPGSGSTGGNSEGWVKESGNNPVVYATYPPKGSLSTLSTQFFAVNSQGVAVGTYEDSKQNWHGFTVSGIFSGNASSYAWSSAIDQGDKTDTVVTGIDNAGDICGWDHASDGKIHGFVGLL
jgi:hypothetical protein